MGKFKAGIIGCGNIHPMHAISLKKIENAELVAVCDIKEDRAKKRAEFHKCDYYLDYKEMIDKAGIDVVHICTPHYMHAPMALYAASKGKHIMTEKPMAITKEDAIAMIEAARKNKVTLGVIFQNRYNPGSQLIKNTLKSGELGKVISGKLTVTWQRTDEYYSESDWKGTWDKEGGGVVIDQAIHTMDLLRWFVDSEIEYVDANIGNRAHQIIQVEDSAEGVIKYKNGVVTGFWAINYYGWNAPVEIELYCEKGLAKLECETAVIKFNDGREIKAGPDPNEFIDYGNFKTYWGVSHIKQIRQFYESLAKGVEPEINGEDAFKTQEMICAVYQSGKEKHRIIF
jgi:UDP-N-acetyl-2-amino-2-deoxyglucuronate dehydrogenase